MTRNYSPDKILVYAVNIHGRDGWVQAALCAKQFQGMDIILPRTRTGDIAGIVVRFGPDQLEPTVPFVTKLLTRMGVLIDTGQENSDTYTLRTWIPYSPNVWASGTWLVNLMLPFSKKTVTLIGPNRMRKNG